MFSFPGILGTVEVFVGSWIHHYMIYCDLPWECLSKNNRGPRNGIWIITDGMMIPIYIPIIPTPVDFFVFWIWTDLGGLSGLVSKAHLLSRLIDLDRDGQFFVFVDNWEVIMKLNLSTKMDDKWMINGGFHSKHHRKWMMMNGWWFPGNIHGNVHNIFRFRKEASSNYQRGLFPCHLWLRAHLPLRIHAVPSGRSRANWSKKWTPSTTVRMPSILQYLQIFKDDLSLELF